MSPVVLVLILVGVVLFATLVTLAVGDDRKRGRRNGGDGKSGTWWNRDEGNDGPGGGKAGKGDGGGDGDGGD